MGADRERERAVSPFMDTTNSHYTGHRVSHGHDPDVLTEDPRMTTLLPVVPRLSLRSSLACPTTATTHCFPGALCPESRRHGILSSKPILLFVPEALLCRHVFLLQCINLFFFARIVRYHSLIESVWDRFERLGDRTKARPIEFAHGLSGAFWNFLYRSSSYCCKRKPGCWTSMTISVHPGTATDKKPKAESVKSVYLVPDFG